MSINLKKEFLSLLEKDTEFRYAVAGYLGLSENTQENGYTHRRTTQTVGGD